MVVNVLIGVAALALSFAWSVIMQMAATSNDLALVLSILGGLAIGGMAGRVIADRTL